jgi:hypothetical protein
VSDRSCQGCGWEVSVCICHGADAARRNIHHILDDLNEDEARVVLTFARRISAGRDAYGPLDLARDRRDFRKEAGEEALDLAAYLAFELVRVKP